MRIHRTQERNILRQVWLALSWAGATLFRNNVGLFRLADGRRVRTGLCIGSSDLIGWTTLEVTVNMVGVTVAVFTAVEVKGNKGKLTDEQKRFLDRVTADGGIGIVARSADEAVKALNERRG